MLDPTPMPIIRGELKIYTDRYEAILAEENLGS